MIYRFVFSAAMFSTDFMVCGIAPYQENIVVLTYDEAPARTTEVVGLHQHWQEPVSWSTLRLTGLHFLTSSFFFVSGVTGVVVDPRSPVRPVSFLARSQSHSLHVSSSPPLSSSSSSSLAFPVIRGRRCGCRSSLSSTPRLLPRPLSVPQSAYISSAHILPSCLRSPSLPFCPGISFVIALLITWPYTNSVFSPLSV